MKKTLSITAMLAAALLLLCSSSAYSQNYFEDTVWTKQTDQAAGFWKVKFSNNDSIIVGHGYEYTMFYNAFNGEEIARLPFNAEVHFLDNDTKFIRLNSTRNCFEIFDTKTYQIIDTLENDGLKIYEFYTVNSIWNRLTTVVQGGLRVYDLLTKRIIFTKQFPTVDGLIRITTNQITYTCDNSKLILNAAKLYRVSDSPPKDVETINMIIYDANTLDSIGSYGYFNYFRISNNCQYIAYKTGDPTYGVEIYDFNTKMLLHKLPVNGPSLTGIEFSPDDKYIVTSNGPGQNSLIVWDVFTGEKKYGYYETSFRNFDISNTGLQIVTTVSNWMGLFITHFSNTSLPLIEEKESILYPNPATGEVTIDLSNLTLKGVVERVRVFDVLGIKHPVSFAATPLTEGNLRLNVSHLPAGVYFVQIGSRVQRFVKM